MNKRVLSLISILIVAFMLQGCPDTLSSNNNQNGKSEKAVAENVADGNNEEKHSDEEAEAIDCLLLVEINYESNVVMAKYSIIVSLDGEEIATVGNGNEYFGSFDVKSGKHELTFEKNGDSKISNSYSFDVNSNCTVYCSLKSHLDYIEITEKDAKGEAVCPSDQHQWEEATCLSPMTCKVCGLTVGDVVDHKPGSWQTTKQATCTEEGEESSACTICGETITRNVDKIPHNVEQWEIVKDPTCTVVGEEKGVCTECGQEITRSIDKIAHDSGDWEIEKEASFSEPGVRVKKCKECGEVTKREEYNLTEEEQVAWLKDNCQSGMYDAISRDPNAHKGDYVKFTCTIVQVCSEAKSSKYYSEYRGATNGSYEDVAYLYIDNYGESRILEDDKITVYGVSDGLLTYETVLGSTVTIPKIIVLYYEQK
ncbi:MAG: hypothetical protein J5636_05790 [Clostridiales bacterium]|nr:hypothetical protein [Clostridiales bacterium]